MQFFGGSEISPSPPVPTASGNNAYMLYIFNRNGVCLLYREWNRPLKTLNSHQDHKLMFGLLFSLKSLTAKMDPTWYPFFSSKDRFFFFLNIIYRPVDFYVFVNMVCSVLICFFLPEFIVLFGSVDKGNLGVPQLPGQGCSFHSFRTNTYKLSFMESPSGIKVS